MFAFTTSAQSDAPVKVTKGVNDTEATVPAPPKSETKACCAKSATGEKKSCSSEDKAASTGAKDGKACCSSASTGAKDGKACCSSASTADKKSCSSEEKAACSGKKDGKACCAKTADAKSSEKPKVKTKTVKATDTKISN